MPAVNVSLDLPKFKAVMGKIKQLLAHNIEYVILHEAVPHLIDLIMVGFDSLADRANMLPEDPTNPGNWREEFLTRLNEDVYDTISITPERITFQMGDKNFLGYDQESSDSTEPLVWMVYYLEGLLGDWAFISPDTYQSLTGRSYQPTWGRFAQGFMISKEEYVEKGYNAVIPFETVRHPFSGYSPLDIFSEAVNEWRFKPFIDKAVKATVEGRKL